MIEEDIFHNKFSFWLIWLIANSLGLGIAWSTSELFGLQVANSLGWKYGQVAGFLIFEGIIWLIRWVVLSRVNNFRVLNSIDTFAWLLAEGLGWFVGSVPYNKNSLVGVASGSILAYYCGVLVWLIIWLIRVQRPIRHVKLPFPRNAIASFSRITGSIFIVFFVISSMAMAMTIGDVIAKSFGLLFGRIISGVIMGAGLSSITGWAMLSLIRGKVWGE